VVEQIGRKGYSGFAESLMVHGAIAGIAMMAQVAGRSSTSSTEAYNYRGKMVQY
jgi:hypothetical protein